MVDVFHWSIFGFHFAAACLITFGVWFRCDPDVWVSRLYVDEYEVQPGSVGVWWYQRDNDLLRGCGNSSDSKTCFNADLPLYERQSKDLGWHLFVLLGHFEWISAAFAFFYVKHAASRFSWIVGSSMVVLGTLLFMPYRGSAFINEVLLLVANCVICVAVFYGYRGIHGRSRSVAPSPEENRAEPQAEPAPAADHPSAPLVARARLGGIGNLVAESLTAVELPALRFCEYCITASELWVAVLCVYVQDPPAFMTIGGYTLIFLTNLYGLLLHYSLVSDDVKVVLAAQPELPRQVVMLKSRGCMRVPPHMLGVDYAEMYRAGAELIKKRVWGSYIASNSSTLLNSWLAYLVATALIFYQETFLFSSDPPAFVVFAGWNLIVTYTSFGVWVTFVYWFPKYAGKLCWCLPDKDTFVIVVYGLDVLSMAAKLAIVGALSYGFVFREEGRC